MNTSQCTNLETVRQLASFITKQSPSEFISLESSPTAGGLGKFLCHIRNNTTKLSIDNETHPTIIHAILLYHQDIHDRTLAGHANSVW